MAHFENRFEGTNYGAINQAGRDVNVTSVTVTSLDALIAAGKLRGVLGDLRLAPGERDLAGRELDALERQLREPEPQRDEVARGLDRFIEVLRSAGAMASAGAALFGPIGVIAGFLGPIGDAVVAKAREAASD